MMYIATFFSHFGAMRFKKAREKMGQEAEIMPVPRSLSSSCGTCVQYESTPEDATKYLSEEIEQIVEVDGSTYTQIYKAENS